MAHLYLGNKVTEQERLRLLGLVSTYFKLDLYTGSDTTSLPNVNARGLAKSMTEMPKIFHLSKINLNFTSKPIRSGLPLRIWDIMSAGGFVLTNFQIEIFSSQEELLDKITYYLEHEEERKQIASNGYERAKREYSLDTRIGQMLDSI